TTAATPTCWRCTSAICVARSTCRSTGVRSRPCAAWVIGWQPTVADAAAAGEAPAEQAPAEQAPKAESRRRGRLGIHARLTVAATALVALVLIGGAVVLTV